MQLHGVGVEIAGQFLVTAGDNTNRIHNEAAFAKLSASHPSQPAADAPSDVTDSAAAETERPTARSTLLRSSASRHQQPTRDYVQRRSAEGLSKREIIRCLKRYIAREIYNN
jgi:hypothetical protein